VSEQIASTDRGWWSTAISDCHARKAAATGREAEKNFRLADPRILARGETHVERKQRIGDALESSPKQVFDHGSGVGTILRCYLPIGTLFALTP
jgi:hypothetical protein